MRNPILISIAASVVVAGSAAGFATLPAHAEGAQLTAQVVQTSVWSTGYGAHVVIDNHGDAASASWVVEIDLPTGTTVSDSWSTVRTETGQHYTFTNVDFNGDITPGAQENFGFNASGLGLPYNCTINGVPCEGETSSPSSSPSQSSPPAQSLSPSPSRTGTGGPVADVTTSAQLSSALANATPGQTIRLAAGTYHGAFITKRAGTAAAPITLTGPRAAILVNDGPAGAGPSCPAPATGWDSGYGLWLFNAPYWNLTGFTVADSKKGIVLDNSQHVTLDGVYVHHTEEEGVHFRRSSADGIIRNSIVTYTGLVQPGYGEGVYIGSAGPNWTCLGNSGGVDRSNGVHVLNNQIGPYVAAEHIDVKEGTFDGVIRGNTFDGRGISGMTYADSWVDIKGIDYTIENNRGTFTTPGTFANGYETHNPSTTPSFRNGCGNVWRNNSSDLGGVGQYAINVTSRSKCSGNLNVVYSSNTVTSAVTGLTNIPLTP